MKTVIVKQPAPPAEPIPTEVIADSIKAIADGMRRLRGGRLNDRALILLIQNAAPAHTSITDVKNVLAGIDALEREYLRPVK